MDLYTQSPFATMSLNKLSTMGKLLSTSSVDFSNLEEYVNLLDTLDARTAQAVISQSSLDEATRQTIISNSRFADTLVANQEGAAASTLSLSGAYQGLAASIGISTAALTGVLAAVAAIGIGIYIFQKLHKSTAELKQEADEAAENYQNLASEVDSINTSLEDLESQMQALEDKDNLTFVEQEELQKLKDASEEMKIQLEIAQALERAAQKEARETTLDYLNKKSSGRMHYTGWDMSQVDIGNAYMGVPETDIYYGTSIDITRDMLTDYESLIKKQEELNERKKELENDHPNDYANTLEYKNLVSESSQVEQEIKLLSTEIPEALKELEEYKVNLDVEQDAQLLASIATVEDMFSASFSEETPEDVTQSFDAIWNSESFSKCKEELIKLSKAGKVDSEVLDSNEKYKQLLEATGKSAEETADHINAIVATMDIEDKHPFSDTISTLDEMEGKWNTIHKLYGSFNSKDFKGFDTSSLADLVDAFKDVEGVNIESFLATLINTESTADDIQDAFNQLSTEFIYASGCLEGLNEATAQQVTKELELQGITNASALVQEHLSASREYSAYTGKELADSTDEEVMAFLNEASASDTAKQYIAQLEFAKLALNKSSIDTVDDINQLINLANAAKISSQALGDLDSAKRSEAAVYQLEAARAVKEGSDLVDPTSPLFDPYAAKQGYHSLADPTSLILSINPFTIDDISDPLIPPGGGAAPSSPAPQEPTVFDFMENRIDHLNSQIDKLKDNIDILVGYKAKNASTDTVIDLLIQKMSSLQQMHDKYMEEANKMGLPQEYIDKVQSGSMEIEYIKDENLVSLIQQYKDWYEKAQSVNDSIEEAQKSLHELSLSKLDNIINQFQIMADIQSQMIDTEKQLLDLLQASGEAINAQDYISLAAKQLSLAQINANAYHKLLAEMSNMNLPKDSDEWKKYNDQLQEYKNSMISAADAVEQYKDAMTELVYQDLEDFKSAMDSINGTISTMSSLIGNTDLVDEFGKLTDRGLAQVALYAHQLANSKQEAAEYSEAIRSLDEALSSGLITQSEYNSMLYDYTSAQESAVSASKEAKDAILSLVKEGIQAEIDAKRKLIDETKAALQAEQDLHDYQTSVAEKQDNISKLQRQIAALANSSDRADIARRLQLQSQLAQAQEDLYETQYDHEMEQRQNALDEEYNAYESNKQKEMDELDTNLDAQEAAINEYLEQVKNNYSAVYGVLTQYGDEYSLNALEALTSPWTSGSDAAALCAGAIGEAVANIQYEINSLDFSPLYELADLLGNMGLGEYGGGAADSQFEDISSKGQWQTGQNGRYWFGEPYDANGNYYYAANGIYTINGRQYGFDEDGYIIDSGWDDRFGEWRYFEPSNGELVRSAWRTASDGSYYYLDKNGVMATNMAIKSEDGSSYYYVDETGKYDGVPLSLEQVKQLGYPIGYSSGTQNARKGWNLTDEDGIGAEAIITNEGILKHFSGGETVFNSKMTQRLWNFANDPSEFFHNLHPGLNLNTPQISSVKPLQNSVEFHAPLFQIDGGLSSDMVGYIDEKCNWLKNNVGTLAYKDLKQCLLGK